jgi:SAM-dependent methyltransferase
VRIGALNSSIVPRTKQSPPLPGQTGGQHWLVSHLDQSEIYGAHVVRRFLETASPFSSVLDIGAGSGRDLAMAKAVEPGAELHGVEIRPPPSLLEVISNPIAIDVEHARLPFEDESLDLVIANQILEHTKEIFWITHEISRVLKVGGHLILGVPNVASFHNRCLMLFGRHPTQHKLYYAHVRVFSRRDTEKFLAVCWPGGYTESGFAGSQFYPFPTPIGRLLSMLFPAASVCIFWLLTKTKPYSDSFLRHPIDAKLETNFYVGETPPSSSTSAEGG